MTKGFPRMSPKQKELCPSGYVWLTNYNMIQKDFVFNNGFLDEEENCDFYVDYIKKSREMYGDVAVTPAFDSLERPLSNNTVAIYVLHPGVRRINKTLKILKSRRDIK